MPSMGHLFGFPSAPKAPPMVNVYDASGNGQVVGQMPAPFSGVTAVGSGGGWADAQGQWHDIPAPPPPPPDFSGMFADMMSQMQQNQGPSQDTAKTNAAPADASPTLNNDNPLIGGSAGIATTPPPAAGAQNDMTDPNKKPGENYEWSPQQGRWILKGSGAGSPTGGMGVTPPSPV